METFPCFALRQLGAVPILVGLGRRSSWNELLYALLCHLRSPLPDYFWPGERMRYFSFVSVRAVNRNLHRALTSFVWQFGELESGFDDEKDDDYDYDIDSDSSGNVDTGGYVSS